eukprot:NODE_6290_length_586_cov_27.011173_g5879_i0.p2 GENE.NODE_6290_length_586_cov_27.011173_g5879_i0~~NODE_6290_length_586_cov_27.011173_g5879_i0.p2  ORF type:complete len:154 (+),score=22.13 NODE_6290_length_586_cov_27.011173_g5879_i0:56-517(+)
MALVTTGYNAIDDATPFYGGYPTAPVYPGGAFTAPLSAYTPPSTQYGMVPPQGNYIRPQGWRSGDFFGTPYPYGAGALPRPVENIVPSMQRLAPLYSHYGNHHRTPSYYDALEKRRQKYHWQSLAYGHGWAHPSSLRTYVPTPKRAVGAPSGF